MRKLLLAAPLFALAGCLDFSPFSFGDGGGDAGPADAAVSPRDVAVQQEPDLAIDPNTDADHDGYSIGRGDCDDTNPLVNPGAFEIPGNNIDDNCDGHVDEKPAPCDGRALQHPEDAEAFAGAIEICKPWLVMASWDHAVDARARAVRPSFGQKLTPIAGASFGVLATGVAADESQPGFTSPLPGVDLMSTASNPLGAGSFKSKCAGADVPIPATANDPAILTLKLQAPTNAKGFSFKWAFLTAEYPPLVTNTPAALDLFGALVDGKAWKGNAVFDADGAPVTALTLLINSCRPAMGCPAHPCTDGTALLAGTGFEPAMMSTVGGTTGWMSTSAPVPPGQPFTLTFFIYDAVDHLRDSTVLLDGFQWLADMQTCAGGPCASGQP